MYATAPIARVHWRSSSRTRVQALTSVPNNRPSRALTPTRKYAVGPRFLSGLQTEQDTRAQPPPAPPLIQKRPPDAWFCAWSDTGERIAAVSRLIASRRNRMTLRRALVIVNVI